VQFSHICQSLATGGRIWIGPGAIAIFDFLALVDRIFITVKLFNSGIMVALLWFPDSFFRDAFFCGLLPINGRFFDEQRGR
jgi:hypothetical protein